MQNGILKKGGTKKTEKVWERIGRLKEKYPSVHQHYDIEVYDNKKGIVKELVYAKKSHVP